MLKSNNNNQQQQQRQRRRRHRMTKATEKNIEYLQRQWIFMKNCFTTELETSRHFDIYKIRNPCMLMMPFWWSFECAMLEISEICDRIAIKWINQLQSLLSLSIFVAHFDFELDLRHFFFGSECQPRTWFSLCQTGDDTWCKIRN